MSIKKVIDKVYKIAIGPVNCYVIDYNGLTLIDTGFPGSEQKIFKALAKIKKKPEDIKQIILTHLHPDHAGSAGEIQKLLQIPVYAHYIDAALIREGVSLRQPMTLSPGFFPWLIFNIFMKRNKPGINPVNPVIDLQDEQIFPVLSGMRVVHTPGHSAGHVSLFLEKEKLLIAGDICGNNGSFHFSILNEKPDLARETLKRVSKLDFSIACFGHGNPIMDYADKKFADKFQ